MTTGQMTIREARELLARIEGSIQPSLETLGVELSLGVGLRNGRNSFIVTVPNADSASRVRDHLDPTVYGLPVVVEVGTIHECAVQTAARAGAVATR